MVKKIMEDFNNEDKEISVAEQAAQLEKEVVNEVETVKDVAEKKTVEVDANVLAGMLARLEALEGKPKKVRRSTEHYAYVRHYEGNLVEGIKRFWTEKANGTLNEKSEARLFAELIVKNNNGTIKVDWLDFINTDENKWKVKLGEQKAEEIVDNHGTINSVNLNEHENKKFVSREIDLEVISYKYTCKIQILDGEHAGQEIVVDTDLLNLQYMSNFKKVEKKIKSNLDERDARCIPVAKKVLEIIGKSDAPLGVLGDNSGQMDKDVEKKYAEISKEVLTLFLTENIHWTDRHYVFQLALQAYEQTKTKVLSSLDMTFNAANEKYWGKDMLDLTMMDINKKFEQTQVVLLNDGFRGTILLLFTCINRKNPREGHPAKTKISFQGRHLIDKTKKRLNLINLISNPMFIVRSGRSTTEWYTAPASQAFVKGALVYFDGSGNIIPADSTSGDHAGIIQRVIASTDSDYASAKKVPVIKCYEDTILEVDVDSGTALTTAMVGNAYDLTDSDSINVGAQSKKQVTVVGFISATKALVKINSIFEVLRVATT